MQNLSSNLYTKTTLVASSGHLGEIHDCPFYIARDQFELWQNTHLTVDVVPGRGASFSAEIPLGVRFVTKSRLYNDAEKADLRPVGTSSDNVC